MLKEFIESHKEYLIILWQGKIDGLKTKKSPNKMTVTINLLRKFI